MHFYKSRGAGEPLHRNQASNHEAVAQPCSGVLQRWHAHARRTAALLVAMVIPAAGSALAVASIGLDKDLPAPSNVLEHVLPLAVWKQEAAIEAHSFTLFRTELIQDGDSPERLFERLGVTDPGAAAFLRRDPSTRQALLGTAGRRVTVEAGRDGRIKRMSAGLISDGGRGFRRLTVERTPAGFVATQEVETFVAGTRLTSGRVSDAFPALSADSILPPYIARQFGALFAGTVDVRRPAPEDRFAVVYETFEVEGKPVRFGRVLSVAVENSGHMHQAVWFTDPDGEGGYYRPDGRGLQPAYLASPVDVPHISSGFAMRVHPVLHTLMKHCGVDFAAPVGSAVRTVAQGRVEFAGDQGSYGNIVVVSHPNGRSTAYAHLGRIAVTRGQQLLQGQLVGTVGMTGRTTGPHLHFEFRVDGESADPSLMAVAGEQYRKAVAPGSRGSFDRLTAEAGRDLRSALQSGDQRRTFEEG